MKIEQSQFSQENPESSLKAESFTPKFHKPVDETDSIESKDDPWHHSSRSICGLRFCHQQIVKFWCSDSESSREALSPHKFTV